MQTTMQPGDMIAGKYRIDRVLGQGGMGIVVAATNVFLDQRVALKFLLPELLRDSAVVERFLREARASARLRGEHVCRVYDVGIENGAPFMVMELLEGSDLASIVSSSRFLSVAAAADCVLQAVTGLAEAHAAGIVHRDLKPANLFVTKRADGTPLVKILDFGIAKAPTDTQFQLTRTATVMGSPGYMSPEQLRSSRDADARSDIWALGVILYELVAGRPPFVAESITELTLRVAMDPTPPLPGVPRAFEQVVARCLAKDPRQRFGDVAQLAAALAPFGSRRVAETALGTMTMLSTAIIDPALSIGASARAATTLGSSAAAMTSVSRRGPRLRWVMLGSVVAAAIGTVAVVKLGDSETAPASIDRAGATDSKPAAVEPRGVPPAGLGLTTGTPDAGIVAEHANAQTPNAQSPVKVDPSAAIAPPTPIPPPRADASKPVTAPNASQVPAPARPAAAVPKPPPAPPQPKIAAPTSAPTSAPPAGSSPKPLAPKPAAPKPAPAKAQPERDIGESRE